MSHGIEPRTGDNPNYKRLRGFMGYARATVEVYGSPTEFPGEWDWIDALDEVLTDMARSQGVEPPVTLRGVIERLVAA